MSKVAQMWSALTALTVFTAIALRVGLTATSASGDFGTNQAANVANIFCYFTIWSNLVVGFVALATVFKFGAGTKWFAALRIDALVCIIVTAVVYHLLLASETDYTGWSLITDQLLHTVVPILAIVAWAAFGPRPRVSVEVVLLSLILPVVWLVLTFARGAFTGFYPYPFLDPDTEGWGAALITTGVIVVAFIALAFAARAVNNRLSR